MPTSCALSPQALIGALKLRLMTSPESGPFELAVPELVWGIDAADWIKAMVRINSFMIVNCFELGN
jgi:hypothetical protein